MKKLLVLWFIIPVLSLAQITEELDFISPFNGGLAAVQKGDAWGFINESGTLVIPFRKDLVLTTSNTSKYPIFKNSRCLISQSKDGITYFGYIDTKGKTVIPPQFLNATNFNNDRAVALNILKEDIGDNAILGKQVVYYRYFEVIIDLNGNVVTYLNPKGINIVLDKKYLKTPPKITSKKISDNVYAFPTETNKWKLIFITDEIAF